jgi:hypothetical protein
MIRLLLLPLAILAHRTIRVYRTPWCVLLGSHDLHDGECRRKDCKTRKP